MAITPAQIATDIVALLAAHKLYDEEFHDWLNGAVGGGVGLDGKYPLTDRLDPTTVRYTTSPAQLEEDVNGLVTSSSAHAAAALVSETAAGVSETNAAASAVLADTHRSDAVAAKVDAQSAQSAAENAEATAIAQAQLAVTTYDTFDDRYLGDFTTGLEPTVDNDGDALATGAIYWNTTLNKFKVWSGSAWALAFDLSEADNFTWTGLHTFDQYLSLTPMAAPAHTEGRLWYDSAAKALSYYNDEADVTINLGQEVVVRVRNVTGVLIPNGAAVYVSGATGASLPNVALAQADSAATAEVLGIATHDIENNSNGYVTVVGDVNDVDTSAWAAGAELFLSDSVAGGLTSTKPSLNDVRVGYVTVSNVSVGSIKVQVGLPVNHNHPASEITSGTFADARIAESSITQHQAALALATSQITSGTFADARIAASNVTQHEAALSITESQISDLGTYLPLSAGEANELTGALWGGDTTATSGQSIIHGKYVTGEPILTLGSMRGTANPVLARAVKPSTTVSGGYVVTVDNVAWDYAAFEVNPTFKWKYKANAVEATGAEVVLADIMTLDSGGNLSMTGGVSATGAVTGSNLNVANWDTAYGWGDHGTQGYALAANVLALSGGTMTGRLIAGLVEDVSLAALSGSLIIGGDGTGAHIAIDNNEIMAKASATTSSTLNLQVEGGTVACGGPLTATAFTEGGTALSAKYLGISAKAADSSLLNGVAESTSAAANTIVKRQASGYIYGVYFNSSQGAEASAASHYIYQAGSDGFYRKKTLANAQAEIVTAATINAVGTTTNTVNTVAKRDGSGDITARLFRPQYNASATVFNYVNVQNARGTGDNYIRAASLANFRARCMAGYLGDQPYTVSTASPSGGGDGDFWFKREA